MPHLTRELVPLSTLPNRSRSSAHTMEDLVVNGVSTDDELSHDSIHQQREASAIFADEQEADEEKEHRKLLPWWRKPSPWWLNALLPFTGMAMAATIAPRVEIYTLLACRAHRPDIFYEGNSKAMLYASDDNRACFSDQVVSAAVAKLAAIMTTSTGVLSCMTTAWWGSFSDRHGRIRTLGISIWGALVFDAIFILVYHYSELLPGGYWFLVIGSLSDGILGGHITASATRHAYIADTSASASRSRVFSLGTGLFYTGMSLGPALGGLILRSTHNLVSVFYVAAFSHSFYACLIWFVIPESLTSKEMRIASKSHYQRVIDVTTSRGVMPQLKRWFSFLSTLSMFAPSSNHTGSSPSNSVKGDWSLTLVAVSYGLLQSISGSHNNQFQYASKSFGWSSETISYWLSLVGAIRAIFLTIVLPVVIKIFKDKPKFQGSRPRMSEEEELLMDPSNSDSSGPHLHRASSSGPKEPHSSRFDLGLAKFSLGLEGVSFVLLGLALNSVSFTIAAMLGALGSGYLPALQSVALDLYGERGEGETGRFLGALSILHALSSQILGPMMYGVIYANTVVTFPSLIFFVSAAFATFSLVALRFVRLSSREKVALDRIDEDV